MLNRKMMNYFNDGQYNITDIYLSRNMLRNRCSKYL